MNSLGIPRKYVGPVAARCQAQLGGDKLSRRGIIRGGLGQPGLTHPESGVLNMLVLCFLLAISTAQQTARYEKLTLLDGRVITGQVERELDDVLMVRVIKAAGKINYLERVSKQHIAKREFVELPLSGEQSAAEALEPPQEEHLEVIEDKDTYLRAIFEEWRIRNLEVGARRLLKLIGQASEEELEQLDELTRHDLKISLTDFAAKVNLDYALERAKKGYFRLYFLTHFTLEKTQTLLTQAFEAALQAEIACPGHGEGTERCNRADSIVGLINRPGDYEGGRIHAAELSKHISKTMGMARELVRLGQALRRDRQEIVDLNARREQLRELLATVNRARRGR